MKHIVLTGGGTAGHVTPNIAMIPRLQELGYTISYIGSYDGIEKKLIEELDIPYYGISSGKLRRYFDVKNFTDPFKVVKGYGEAARLLKKLKPDVVFLSLIHISSWLYTLFKFVYSRFVHSNCKIKGRCCGASDNSIRDFYGTVGSASPLSLIHI